MKSPPTDAELDAMDETELLFALGRETAGEAAVPQGSSSLIDAGRAVLRRVGPAAHAVLCAEDGPRAILKEATGQTRKQAVAVLLAGSTVGLTTTACLYVAAILLRMGLDRYCAAPEALAEAAGSAASHA